MIRRALRPPGTRLLIAVACVLALLAGLSASPVHALGAYRVPRPQVKKLANGLEIMVFPDARQPLAFVALRISAGVATEPADQNGVAGVTARMLGRGTTSRSAEALARDLSQLGSALVADAGREYTTVSSEFLSRDFENGLELVADAVIHPVFLDDELQRAANAVGRNLVQLHQSPPATAVEQLWTLALPDVPAAQPPFGRFETLEGLNLDEVRAFYRDRYRPGGAVLAIAGDVTPERAYAAAAEWFGSWPAGEPAPAPAAPQHRQAARMRVRIVDVPSASACAIAVGMPMPGRGSVDALARSVAASVFEPHVGDRLARGVVRDVNSSLELTRDVGLWVVEAAVPADSAAVLARRLTAELKRSLFTAASLPDLAAAQKRIRRGFPLAFEPVSALVGQWLLADFADFPADYFDTYAARIGALTPEEVHAAARRDADAEHPYIVAVGPASRVAPLLKPLGPAETVSLDRIAQAAPDTMSAHTPEEAAAGRKLIADALVAHGGRERLAALKTSQVDAAVRVFVSGNEVRGTLRQLRQDPDKLALKTSLVGVETWQVLSGNRGWTMLAESDTAQEADTLQVAALRVALVSDMPHVLVAASDKGARVAARGRERLTGRDVDKVEVVTGMDHWRMLYLDAASHLLLGFDQRERVIGGFAMGRRLLSDYRPLGGVQWPFHEERFIANQPLMRLDMTGVLLNVGIDAKYFEPPATLIPWR